MSVTKNASGGVYLAAYDTGATPVAGKTGDASNITGSWSKDGGAETAGFTTAHPTEIGGGVYWQPVTAAETNGDKLSYRWTSTTSGVVIDPIFIETQAAALTNAGIAAAVWDEVLTGATHNINQSSGKLLRTLNPNPDAIYSGTAPSQAGMTNVQIKLDSGASATDNLYRYDVISITAGTGQGQSRMVMSYAGGTKVATVDSAWSIQPDNTSVFDVTPTARSVAILMDGVAHGGTPGSSTATLALAYGWIKSTDGHQGLLVESTLADGAQFTGRTGTDNATVASLGGQSGALQLYGSKAAGGLFVSGPWGTAGPSVVIDCTTAVSGVDGGPGIQINVGGSGQSAISLTPGSGGYGLDGSLSPAAMASFFLDNSGKVYADAVAGSVVKEIASNAGGTVGTVDANIVSINSVSTSPVTTIGANVGTTQPVNFQGIGAAAFVKCDVELVKGATSQGTAGYVGIDWGQVANKTTTNALTGTTISTSQQVASVTGAVGSVTGSVGGNVSGSVGSVTGNVGGSITGNVGGSVGSLSSTAKTDVAAAVLDVAIASHELAGSVGAAIAQASSAGDPLATLVPGGYVSGTAGYKIGNFLDAAITSRLAPTTGGRTLDVSATGEAGLDWSNIGAPTSTVDLSGTTIAEAQNVTNVLGDVAGSVSSVTTGVPLDLTATVPTVGNVPNSIADCLNVMRAMGGGKWRLDVPSKTLNLYAPDNLTVVASFLLDNATTPTSRTPQ